MLWLIILVPVVLLLISQIAVRLVKGLCEKRSLGQKTFDNLLQSTIMFASSAALNLAFVAFIIAHRDGQWNINFAIALFVFCVGLWATNMNAYRIGYKTQFEWGA